MMDTHTGKALQPEAHLAQSVAAILRTPLGELIMAFDYGSELPLLIDSPLNPEGLGALSAAAIDAVLRWESRLQLRRARAQGNAEGGVTLTLEGVFQNEPVRLAVPIQ